VSTTALIVSLDQALIRMTAMALEQVGFETIEFSDPSEVLQHLQGSDEATLVVVDWDLPGPGAVDLCRELRSNPQTSLIPILAINVAAGVEDKIHALKTGADDFVGKPVHADELAVRAKSLRDHRTGGSTVKRLQVGSIDMDLDRWTLTVQGEAVDLTNTEFRLLQVLLEARGRVLTRDALLAQVWSQDGLRGEDTRTVDVHIGRLRRKLGPCGRYIITVRNVGFRCALLPDWLSHHAPHGRSGLQGNS
jgi:two-component system, OmpR family, alkaline phosphatase synthesis response regulator PhoP